MSEPSPFLMVGLGASAGGISALEAFFMGIPIDCGMAFIVVTHLSPDRESHLTQVLQTYTQLPVRVAADGLRVEPSAVYVMPPAVALTIRNGTLRITPNESEHRERKLIDVFFASLAEDQGESAVGVVMSGGDADGALGVKTINERGGITFAQTTDAVGPQNPQMPNSAIATGIIDFALPAGQIADQLLRIAQGRDQRENYFDQAERDEKAKKDLRTVADMVRGRTGHDLSGYKSKTFTRRLLRRMTVTQCMDVPSYILFATDNPEELDALFRDLLINVTDFFRDADAFDALETLAIKEICEQAGPSGTIRVWVPACSTGEEAYSIAMLLREELDRRSISPRVQIFATDISEGALGIARSARYPESLLGAVSPQRRQKFFTRDGDSYVVAKHIRELCVFSPHSLISDPPFSRIDLISCRNLLIYFGSDLQRRVFPIFHYALRPGGFLLLGLSENVTHHSDLFVPVSKTHRLFKRRDAVLAHSALPLPLVPLRSATAPFAPTRGVDPNVRALRQAIEGHVLDKYAPAHVVVNPAEEVVYFSTRTGPYLEHPRGAPERQLLALTRAELRADVRAALRDAAADKRHVRRHAFLIEDDQKSTVVIDAEPIGSDVAGTPNILLVFRTENKSAALPPNVVAESELSRTATLERTIREMAEKLQSNIEEYETALEELKSANEEMLSVNEELQSTNEELEASKEEMQSLNEELNTINSELNTKVDEIDRAHSDLRNLYESTQIASVFLDRDLVIRQFTPAAHKFFAIRKGDIGRPLTELASVAAFPNLEEQISSVSADGQTIERQFDFGQDRARYLVRLIPYRRTTGEIDGVVVTFFDVTQLAQAQVQQEILIAELNHRVKNMLTVVVGIVRQTLGTEDVKPEATARLLGRVQSMARVYSLLSEEHWTDIGIKDLVEQELIAFGKDRIRTYGNDVRVSPEIALPLSMVVHELATNAAKYGALSNDKGYVEAKWSKGGGRLNLQWKEFDGPPVKKWEQKGFGFVLIKGQIEHQLGGSLKITSEPEGVRIEIDVPA